MFGSNKTSTTGTTSNTNTGFLSRLRSSNRPATAKKPVYASSTGTRKTSGTKTGGLLGKKKSKTVATGLMPMSHHRTKPTLGQKIRGAATVVSGKIHNDHREVRQGERE